MGDLRLAGAGLMPMLLAALTERLDLHAAPFEPRDESAPYHLLPEWLSLLIAQLSFECGWRMLWFW